MAVFGIRSAVRAQLADGARFHVALAFVDECFDAGSPVRRRIEALAPGLKERIELTGGVFALIEAYRTFPREERRWETHVRHIDVQTIVEGAEFADIANRDRLRLTEDRTPAEDVIFYEGGKVRGSALYFCPGDVGVYFPTDAHRSGIVVDEPVLVRKVVVKVPLVIANCRLPTAD